MLLEAGTFPGDTSLHPSGWALEAGIAPRGKIRQYAGLWRGRRRPAEAGRVGLDFGYELQRSASTLRSQHHEAAGEEEGGGGFGDRAR